MTTAISAGIKISAESSFEECLIRPNLEVFVFAYSLIIENGNSFPVQLIERRIHTCDSSSRKDQDPANGAMGKRPVLEPGGKFTYHSTCHFNTEAGKVSGRYLMKNLGSGEVFEVKVPEFVLIVPHKLN